MENVVRFLLAVFSVFIFISDVYASDTIKVLILNETNPRIPARNEKIEKIGSMEGNILVMGSRYSGDIDIWRGDGGLYIVNELPLEEYVKDVVAAEVGQDWDMEALKVQAVISRTYAVYQKMMSTDSIYQIASSVINQVYKGSSPDVRIAYAVSQTNGEILTFEGKPIEAFYHSTCGGKTENPGEVFGKSYPYLRSVESPCDLSPYSTWERDIPLEEIERGLNISGIREISIKSYTSTGRVKQLAIRTHSGVVVAVNATDLRKALGWSRLPSTKFTLSQDGGSFLFKGSGYGHGVGLCQWGALQMAREGKNYRDILSFYYPGTSIQLYEDH
jgi:stage II sporulation protein D